MDSRVADSIWCKFWSRLAAKGGKNSPTIVGRTPWLRVYSVVCSVWMKLVFAKSTIRDHLRFRFFECVSILIVPRKESLVYNYSYIASRCSCILYYIDLERRVSMRMVRVENRETVTNLIQKTNFLSKLLHTLSLLLFLLFSLFDDHSFWFDSKKDFQVACPIQWPFANGSCSCSELLLNYIKLD